MDERFDYQRQLEEQERQQQEDRELRKQVRAWWKAWADKYDKENSNAEH
jgi:hypothetical protein